MTDILTVENLASSYGEIRVVHDISFSVAGGQVVALLGRNGAGKTTVLRAISGLNPISSGSVTLLGRPMNHLPVYKRVEQGIAYVQEGKRVFKELTVEQNLMLGGYAAKANRATVARDIQAAYERFPILGQRQKSSASALSGGQQQMLAIAQALISKPKVLLLDEPSGGLAPSIVGEVLDIVRGLVAEGLSVVLVEQAVNFALSIADHVLVMDLGRCVLSEPAGTENLGSKIEDAYFAAA